MHRRRKPPTFFAKDFYKSSPHPSHYFQFLSDAIAMSDTEFKLLYSDLSSSKSLLTMIYQVFFLITLENSYIKLIMRYHSV